MPRKCAIITALILTMFPREGIWAQSSRPSSKQEYIERYHELAVKEMKRSGIPASITLSQGMLESDNGNSRLAVKAKNHFGIKCHDWQGKKIRHDDDEKKECFRKYRSVYESYRDHSDFLMNTPRYAALFELKTNDYRGWAKGLKKAGYATNRKYSAMLVRIIEENELYRFDEGIKPRWKKENQSKKLADIDDPDFGFRVEGRTIYERNRIDYIIVQEGDTYVSLTDEMELMPFELAKYNELSMDSHLVPGQALYLQPKRNKAAIGNDIHIAGEGETMYDIAQQYGIKLKKLLKRNRMDQGQEPGPGQKIWLRGRKK